ncbi:MAG: hypothetical protein JWO20_430 [Candidatus Angelobacter sp.]|nr:hypothetical protein [Candidatus Angelobacter sp.]
MRYMMLIYSLENESATPEEFKVVAAAHSAVMDETNRRGIFRAADPLESTSTATTVRKQDGKVLVTDGPFAETKEQLAGYYILDCQNLDEALEWAAKIPTACRGSAGYVEVRPIREIGKPNTAHG